MVVFSSLFIFSFLFRVVDAAQIVTLRNLRLPRAANLLLSAATDEGADLASQAGNRGGISSGSSRSLRGSRPNEAAGFRRAGSGRRPEVPRCLPHWTDRDRDDILEIRDFGVSTDEIGMLYHTPAPLDLADGRSLRLLEYAPCNFMGKQLSGTVEFLPAVIDIDMMLATGFSSRLLKKALAT
jgi:hypothetical protein